MERVDFTSLPAGTECVGRWLKSEFGWPRTWDGCHGSYAPPADDDRGRVLLYTIPTLIPQRALVSVCRFCGHGESNLRTLHFGKRLRNRTVPPLVFAFLSVRVSFFLAAVQRPRVHEQRPRATFTSNVHEVFWSTALPQVCWRSTSRAPSSVFCASPVLFSAPLGRAR